jgi:hypothetical protein
MTAISFGIKHISTAIGQRLTWTSLTHWFTPSSLPSTYITPGGPPLRSRTKTSWKVAACLSLATFFRLVMWCVRINALWRHCIASWKLMSRGPYHCPYKHPYLLTMLTINSGGLRQARLDPLHNPDR